MARDPVCGMWLKPDQVAATYTYLGRAYAFCCVECRNQFAQDANTYLVLLAHEPGESMGFCCPVRRRALTGED